MKGRNKLRDFQFSFLQTGIEPILCWRAGGPGVAYAMIVIVATRF